MVQLLDGRAVSAEIKAEVAAGVAELSRRVGRAPGLAVVLIGDDPASKVYVRRIGAACKEVGIRLDVVALSESTTAHELRSALLALGDAPATNGIIVQMPLPRHLAALGLGYVTDVLPPGKDVDGIHPENVGLLSLGRPVFVPSTPLGGLELLRRTGIDLRGAEAVIVGRSSIVGRPMANLLINEHATVTVCHSRTRDLATLTRRADILVAAIGRARMITAEMVKPGAVVIDFGINPTPAGIVGDVDFDSVRQVAGWLTPVPGGTGPMTNAMLMRNTLAAARNEGGTE